MAKKLAEIQYGDGAVSVVGKILVQETGSECLKAFKQVKVEIGNLIAGVLIAQDGKTLLSRIPAPIEDRKLEEGLEMWEVELIIVPKRKYRINKAETEFANLKMDQKLCGAWWGRENWKEQIFPKNPEVNDEKDRT